MPKSALSKLGFFLFLSSFFHALKTEILIKLEKKGKREISKYFSSSSVKNSLSSSGHGLYMSSSVSGRLLPSLRRGEIHLKKINISRVYMNVLLWKKKSNYTMKSFDKKLALSTGDGLLDLIFSSILNFNFLNWLLKR